MNSKNEEFYLLEDHAKDILYKLDNKYHIDMIYSIHIALILAPRFKEMGMFGDCQNASIDIKSNDLFFTRHYI